jgi:hypothetical protein
MHNKQKFVIENGASLVGSELSEVGWIVKKRLSLKGFIFGAMTFNIPDTQHNDTQHNDTEQ